MRCSASVWPGRESDLNREIVIERLTTGITPNQYRPTHSRGDHDLNPGVGPPDNPPFTVEPDPFEVADIFEVPLQFLADPENHQRHSRFYNGTRREFYAMPYNGYYIWGATAGMIVNLSEALGPL